VPPLDEESSLSLLVPLSLLESPLPLRDRTPVGIDRNAKIRNIGWQSNIVPGFVQPEQ
jgi:hypothetical protein